MKFLRTVFQNIPELADAAYKRFRLPVVVAIISSLIGMYIVYQDHVDSDRLWILRNMLMALYLSLPALLTVYLFAEHFALKAIPACALKLGTLGLFILYYAFMPEHFATTDTVRYLFYCIATIGTLFFVPLTLGYGSYAARRFLLGLSGRIAWGYFVAMVLFGGLTFAILAIQFLFIPEWHDSWKVISSILVACTGIVFPWVVLAYIPAAGQLDMMPVQEKMTGAIGKFVLIPVVSFYLVILYLYFTKVIILSELPKGWVSYLVLSFSAAGIWTYIAVLEEARIGGGIAPRFAKWLWRTLLPLLFLLWYAIAQRTEAYGVTERRYILIVMAVLLSVWVIYFIISKGKNILIIPTTLAVAAVVISGGPWGAFEVSFRSQRGELVDLLNQYELLADGRITALKGEMPFADRKKLSSVLMYLEEHWGLERIGDLLPADITLATDNGRDRWAHRYYSDASDTKKVLDKIGVRYVNDYEQENDQSDYFSVNTYQASGALPLDGFTGVVHLVCPGRWKEGKQEPPEVTVDDMTFEAIKNCSQLQIRRKDQTIYTTDLGDMIRDIFQEHPDADNLNDLPLQKVAFTHFNDELNLFTVINSAYGRRTKKSPPHVNQIQMQVYWSVKSPEQKKKEEEQNAKMVEKLKKNPAWQKVMKDILGDKK